MICHSHIILHIIIVEQGSQFVYASSYPLRTLVLFEKKKVLLCDMKLKINDQKKESNIRNAMEINSKRNGIAWNVIMNEGDNLFIYGTVFSKILRRSIRSETINICIYLFALTNRKHKLLPCVSPLYIEGADPSPVLTSI